MSENLIDKCKCPECGEFVSVYLDSDGEYVWEDECCPVCGFVADKIYDCEYMYKEGLSFMEACAEQEIDDEDCEWILKKIIE